MQVSDKMEPRDLVSLVAMLNPDNVPGRLSVIVRMGANKLRAKFPALIEAVRQAGQVRGGDGLVGADQGIAFGHEKSAF